MAEPIIELKGISKKFAKSVILDDVNLKNSKGNLYRLLTLRL